MKVFFFQLWYRPIWKWVIYPAHASPSSSPSYNPFRPIYYFLQIRLRKQMLQYIGAARSSIVRVKAKAGVQGAERLGGGQGAKLPEANAL